MKETFYVTTPIYYPSGKFHICGEHILHLFRGITCGKRANIRIIIRHDNLLCVGTIGLLFLFFKQFLHGSKLCTHAKHLHALFKLFDRREGRCDADVGIAGIFMIRESCTGFGHDNTGFFGKSHCFQGTACVHI